MQEWLDKCVRLGNGGVFIGWLTTMVWLFIYLFISNLFIVDNFR